MLQTLTRMADTFFVIHSVSMIAFFKDRLQIDCIMITRKMIKILLFNLVFIFLKKYRHSKTFKILKLKMLEILVTNDDKHKQSKCLN